MGVAVGPQQPRRAARGACGGRAPAARILTSALALRSRHARSATTLSPTATEKPPSRRMRGSAVLLVARPLPDGPNACTRGRRARWRSPRTAAAEDSTARGDRPRRHARAQSAGARMRQPAHQHLAAGSRRDTHPHHLSQACRASPAVPARRFLSPKAVASGALPLPVIAGVPFTPGPGQYSRGRCVAPQHRVQGPNLWALVPKPLRIGPNRAYSRGCRSSPDEQVSGSAVRFAGSVARSCGCPPEAEAAGSNPAGRVPGNPLSERVPWSPHASAGVPPSRAKQKRSPRCAAG